MPWSARRFGKQIGREHGEDHGHDLASGRKSDAAGPVSRKIGMNTMEIDRSHKGRRRDLARGIATIAWRISFPISAWRLMLLDLDGGIADENAGLRARARRASFGRRAS